MSESNGTGPIGLYSPRRDWSKSRIPPIVVNSADCTIVIDGKEKELHPGETFRIVPTITLNQHKAVRDLLRKPEDQPEDEYNKAVWALLRDEHIISWDWTNIWGEALPQPQDIEDPGGILTNEEIAAAYFGVLRRGPKPPLEADPNASAPTLDGSSADPLPATAPS